MTSATRAPKLPVVVGCLRGLAALMYNFTKSVDEGMLFFYVSYTVQYILAIIQPTSSTTLSSLYLLYVSSEIFIGLFHRSSDCEGDF